MRTAFEPAVRAYATGDLAKAKAGADRLVDACGDGVLSGPPRTLRASIALSEKDYDKALALMQPVAKPDRGGMGPYPNFVELRALAGKKDAPGFAAARAALVAASATALTSAPIRGKRIETIDLPTATVEAIEARFKDESFAIHYVFLIAPKADFALPSSIELSQDGVAGLLGGGNPYFVDFNTCTLHATLTILERRPDYKRLRKLVTEAASGEGGAVSSTEGGDPVCAAPSRVVPGLD